MKKIVCTLLLCLGSIMLCGCANNGNYTKIKKLVEGNEIKFIAKDTENWTEEVEIVSYGATGIMMTNRTVLDFYGTIIVQYLYIEWNKNDAYISFTYTQDGREQSYDYEKTSVVKQYIKEGKVSSIEGCMDPDKIEYVNKLLDYVDEYLKENYGYGIAD